MNNSELKRIRKEDASMSEPPTDPQIVIRRPNPEPVKVTVRTQADLQVTFEFKAPLETEFTITILKVEMGVNGLLTDVTESYQWTLPDVCVAVWVKKSDVIEPRTYRESIRSTCLARRFGLPNSIGYHELIADVMIDSCLLAQPDNKVQRKGLKNHGCTCYLNSLMQCLYNIGLFRHFVFEQTAAKDAEVLKTVIEYMRSTGLGGGGGGGRDPDSHGEADEEEGDVLLDNSAEPPVYLSDIRRLLDKELESLDFSAGALSASQLERILAAKTTFCGVDVESLTEENSTTISALQRLFAQMDPAVAVDTMNVVECLPLIMTFGWEAEDLFIQHDVQELNRLLMDKLEDDDLKKIFCGTVENTIQCIDVDYKSSRTEEFYDLQLDLAPSNLLGSLQDLQKVEILDGDNAYDCDNHGKQRAEKKQNIKHYPEVLEFQLKRFQYDPASGYFLKRNDHFEFPPTLNLGPDLNYELIAVSVHEGELNSGHYYSYVNCIEPNSGCCAQPNSITSPTGIRQWYLFDDETVSISNQYCAITNNFGSDKSTTRSDSAYILFYMKNKDLPHTPLPPALQIRLYLEDFYERYQNELREIYSSSFIYNVIDETEIHRKLDGAVSALGQWTPKSVHRILDYQVYIRPRSEPISSTTDIILQDDEHDKMLYIAESNEDQFLTFSQFRPGQFKMTSNISTLFKISRPSEPIGRKRVVALKLFDPFQMNLVFLGFCFASDSLKTQAYNLLCQKCPTPLVASLLPNCSPATDISLHCENGWKTSSTNDVGSVIVITMPKLINQYSRDSELRTSNLLKGKDSIYVDPHADGSEEDLVESSASIQYFDSEKLVDMPNNLRHKSDTIPFKSLLHSFDEVLEEFRRYVHVSLTVIPNAISLDKCSTKNILVDTLWSVDELFAAIKRALGLASERSILLCGTMSYSANEPEMEFLRRSNFLHMGLMSSVSDYLATCSQYQKLNGFSHSLGKLENLSPQQERNVNLYIIATKCHLTDSARMILYETPKSKGISIMANTENKIYKDLVERIYADLGFSEKEYVCILYQVDREVCMQLPLENEVSATSGSSGFLLNLKLFEDKGEEYSVLEVTIDDKMPNFVQIHDKDTLANVLKAVSYVPVSGTRYALLDYFTDQYRHISSLNSIVIDDQVEFAAGENGACTLCHACLVINPPPAQRKQMTLH